VTRPLWSQHSKLEESWKKANSADILLLSRYEEHRQNIEILGFFFFF